MPDLETEEEAAERIAKTSGNDKVFNILRKINNTNVKIDNLDEMATDKLNKWSLKLNKLNNDIEKLDNYIKENNDKKISTEKELDDAENKYHRLLKN